MNKTIVELGKECYWNGSVERLELQDYGKYEATVAVQESYKVMLQKDKQGAILWASCECSCADAPYCKHVMAVFFSVQSKQEALKSCQPKA